MKDGEYSDYDISVYLAFSNLFIQSILYWAGQIIKPINIIDSQISQTFVIFIVQYINTAILVVLCYSSFLSNKEKIQKNDIWDIFVGPFDEFSLRWYLLIGTPIALSIIL